MTFWHKRSSTRRPKPVPRNAGDVYWWVSFAAIGHALSGFAHKEFCLPTTNNVSFSMLNRSLVDEYLASFEILRWVIHFHAAVAIPINVVAIYLSEMLAHPFWVVCLAQYYVPLSQITGCFATGLAKNMGPDVGFGLMITLTYLMYAYLVALVIAICHRINSLLQFSFFSSVLRKKLVFMLGMVLNVVLPAFPGYLVSICYMTNKEYKRAAVELQPDYAPFFDQVEVFGSSFQQRPVLAVCGVLLSLILFWSIFVLSCVSLVIHLLKATRLGMSKIAYRTHVQLVFALSVQTAIPMVFFAIPLISLVCGYLFKISFLDVLFGAMQVMVSLHSILNALTVISIKPYRTVLMRMVNDVSMKILKRNVFKIHTHHVQQCAVVVK
ncbi:hypothetical protein L596_030081 [Steinernema carpocapsae]|uniref:G-protein coupled receptors family 1 profile domain-containing protein n=1 Tax=Steinernema carpocapsae TaxID=34508 RepID=A0A4U5LRP7_STECR|nr:hypothetical protein L596_030081 [Steinernema carpocapsae]